MAYEDFTTYTEVDQGNDLTVDSSTKVSWLNLLSRTETAYLYKDKGANYFGGDFNHKFELRMTYQGNYAYPYFWMIANLIADARDIVQVAGGSSHALSIYDDSLRMRLHVVEDGSETYDEWTNPIVGTLYFVEIVRDDDGGANNTGLLTAYIRTGSHTGTLKDTLQVSCSAGQQNDFRYIYAMSSWDDGARIGATTAFTQNLDLGVGDGTTTTTSTSTTTTSTSAPTVSTTTSPPSVSKTLVFVVSS